MQNLKITAALVLIFYSCIQTVYSDLINRELFRKHISILSSDDYMGRGTGQKGGLLAADYLSSQFTAIGLKNPAGLNSYHQNVPLHELRVLRDSKIEFYSGVDTIKPSFNTDFLIHKSGTNSSILKPTRLVFAGFGIIAPEFDYNDYRNINVQNKIVIILSGEPKSDDESFFNGKISTKYSQIDTKRQIALSMGARACIIIPNDDDFSDEYWEYLKNEYNSSEISLAYSPSEILTVIINPKIAKRIFEAESISYDSLSVNYRKNKLKSFELKTEMTFKGLFKDRSFTSSNIIGYIEGSDNKLRDSYLIITAHYDHLGISKAVSGDSIYNGLLDNSMGVAAVLELARIISLMETKPKRSIIFMLTTAEEKGLLGSIHYVANPVFPLYKTIANINIDGIAFIDNFKSVVGIGANLSELGEYLDISCNDMGLYIENFPQEFTEIESFNRSDQIVFASAGVPSVMTMDGTDYKNISRSSALELLFNYMTNYYHSPFDDLNLLINYDAAFQHIEFLLQYILTVSNAEKEPEWSKWSNYYYERIKLRNEKR